MKIQEILKAENNSSIQGKFLISEISLRKFNDREGNFLTFVLQDQTGRIQGRI